jgi:hypothetical protein
MQPTLAHFKEPLVRGLVAGGIQIDLPTRRIFQESRGTRYSPACRIPQQFSLEWIPRTAEFGRPRQPTHAWRTFLSIEMS